MQKVFLNIYMSLRSCSCLSCSAGSHYLLSVSPV
jgi:hypothetical protein